MFFNQSYLAVLAIGAWRMAFSRLYPLMSSPHRVLVVGAGGSGHSVARLLESYSDVYKLAGFVDDDPEAGGDWDSLPGFSAPFPNCTPSHASTARTWPSSPSRTTAPRNCSIIS